MLMLRYVCRDASLVSVATLLTTIQGGSRPYRPSRRPRVSLIQYVRNTSDTPVVAVDAAHPASPAIAHLNSHSPSTDFETSTSNRGKLPPGNSSFLPTTSNSASTSGSSKRFLWSISFYAQFFDVDTNEVLRRCRAVAFPYSNFLDVLDGNPDLYGPFWIATTVVVILFLTGTISQFLAREGKSHFAYDFKLLSGAAGLIYGYTFVIPVGLWAALKWFKSESANLLECVTLYGYANLVWYVVFLFLRLGSRVMSWLCGLCGVADITSSPGSLLVLFACC